MEGVIFMMLIGINLQVLNPVQMLQKSGDHNAIALLPYDTAVEETYPYGMKIIWSGVLWETFLDEKEEKKAIFQWYF